MSSIYTPRPAYQDLGGSIVLHSIIKRFPTFLQCEARFFEAAGDISSARGVGSPLEFRDAVSTLPVNAILGPLSGGVPLTLYVSKPGFDEDFKEVACDIAVDGCDLVRAAPDIENPFFLIFGKLADLPAVQPALASAPSPVVEEPESQAAPEIAAAPAPEPPASAASLSAAELFGMAPEMPAVEPAVASAQTVYFAEAPAVVEPAAVAPEEPVAVEPPVAVETFVPAEAPVAAETLVAAEPPAAIETLLGAEPPVAVETPVAAQVTASPEAPAMAEVPAAPPPPAEPASPVASLASLWPASAIEAEYAQLREQVLAQSRAIAQTQALVQGLAQAAQQQAAQSSREFQKLLANQQAALLAGVKADLAQMQEQVVNRQTMAARQAQTEQADRQMTALRRSQQEQATQLQALLVKLQNEQSESQQEAFRTLERERAAQQQAQTQMQVERPAWYAAGVKETGRAVAEQAESLQAALKAQQDQIIALQKSINEWRSQKTAHVDEPVAALDPEIGVTVTDMAWKVEKANQVASGISNRLGVLFVLVVLVLAALIIGFIWTTTFYGSTLAALRPAPAPTYTALAAPLQPVGVLAEPTVALTGVALKCADANLGRVYYDCTLANGVAYPQTLSLSIIADGGSANGFFPSVTLDGKQIFPDASTTLATLGRFEVGQLKRFRLNVPCSDARGCKPTTFVVRVVDSEASVVPGSQTLITTSSPAP